MAARIIVRIIALLSIVVSGNHFLHAHTDSFEDFRQAFIAGDLGRVEALLKSAANRPPVDADRVTVLHKAIHVYSGSRTAIVARLIDAGST